MRNTNADHVSLIPASSLTAGAAELPNDPGQRSNSNHTEVPMSASIFSDPGKSGYRVEWMEADGYTRERRFDSRHAAERFADQVECRLHIEALAEIAARCESGE